MNIRISFLFISDDEGILLPKKNWAGPFPPAKSSYGSFRRLYTSLRVPHNMDLPASSIFSHEATVSSSTTGEPILIPAAAIQYPGEEQKAGGQEATGSIQVPVRNETFGSVGSSEDDSSSEVTIVNFGKNDTGCPYNWSQNKKRFVVFNGIVTVFNSTLGSALPSNSVTFIANDFGVDSDKGNPELVLPISVFLVGYVLGPLLFGPLSEWSGRRFPILLAFAGYTMSLIGCALVNDWAGMLAFRLLGGVFGGAPLSIIGGLLADIYRDPGPRGRAMSFFMASIILAPLLSPILSGYISEISWRWTFWVALMIAGISWIPLMFLPETYGPVILSRRAARMRKVALAEGHANTDIFAPIDVENRDWRHLVTVILARPLRMFATEMIVLAVCLYLSLAFAIFYMSFQLYPIIFRGVYGMGLGVSGLMFLPIGAGTIMALVMALHYDRYLEKSKRAGKAWTQREESRRLPLACLAGPLYVIALLWLGWSSRSNVPWVVPFLAGIPLGMGTLFVFIGLLNYLGDAYSIYAASAMAAASCCRSIFGAVLPLAAAPMYKAWGIGWASSFLALLSFIMSAVPFAFIYYGDTIRERSAFCKLVQQQLREKTSPDEKNGNACEPNV
ncbi:Major facilitator superfamily multidrug transporter mdrA [Paramyrothecium foliicola]|nr:Major facilitator superfamily multidrug transporter mdrA [Paramyrothecium foliicola]